VKIAIVTDAWRPRTNGVVTTLVDLAARLIERGHEVQVIDPSAFRRIRRRGYGEPAWRPDQTVTPGCDIRPMSESSPREPINCPGGRTG
jgi:hypothetical protein